MSSKIKPRQQRKPRNLVVRDMILRGGETTMRHKKDRRPKDKRRHWSQEEY